MSALSAYEEARLEQIRATLKVQQLDGADVEMWESTFFLRVIDKLRKRKSR